MARLQRSQLDTANPNLDGTGTLEDSFTAGGTGSTLTGLKIVAAGTTTAGMIRLFIYDGTNTRLWDEITVDAIEPSASVKAWQTTMGFSIPLETTWLLKMSTHNGETFNVFAEGTDN